MGNILEMARQRLESEVKPKLAGALNRLEQEVKSPIKKIAETVLGETIWKGKSAKAFVNVVTNRVLPGLSISSQHISTTQKNIQQSIEIMDRADAQVNSEVGKLANVFEGIYN